MFSLHRNTTTLIHFKRTRTPSVASRHRLCVKHPNQEVDARTCSLLRQPQRASCRLHLPARNSARQLTGRVGSQKNSLSPPQSPASPPTSVTCVCSRLRERLWEGFFFSLSLSSISMQSMFPESPRVLGQVLKLVGGSFLLFISSSV